MGWGFAALMRLLQAGNQIKHAGACGLGDGLKVNSSLQLLTLVRLFSPQFLVVAGVVQTNNWMGVNCAQICDLARKSNR